MKYLFYSTVTLYSFIIILSCSFGIIDDHILTETVLVGKGIPFFVIIDVGRFFPLNGQEYNILSHFSTSATFFYFYNLAQFLLMIILTKRLIIMTVGEKYKNISYIIILVIILTPGFTTSWFRLFVPERGAFIFMLIFIYNYLLYMEDSKAIYLVICLISGTLMLYYKEPIFLMLGTFTFLHLILDWNRTHLKQKKLDYLLIVTSLVWIIIYYYSVLIYEQNTLYYEFNDTDQAILFIKNIFNMAINDPIIFFGIPSIIIYRVYMIGVKNSSLEPIYDSMLISSLIYMLVYIKLNIYSVWYLLPLYPFVIISGSYFVFRKKYLTALSLKKVYLIVLILLAIQSIPNGLHQISFYKLSAYNFQQTLTYLKQYINKRENTSKINIFLDGVDPSNRIEVYESIRKYLIYNNISLEKIELKDVFYQHSKNSQKNMSTGDLLIVTPYSQNLINDKYLLSLKDSYNLLFTQMQCCEITDISLKRLIKFILVSLEIHTIIENMNYIESSSFYIYRKK